MAISAADRLILMVFQMCFIILCGRFAMIKKPLEVEVILFGMDHNQFYSGLYYHLNITISVVNAQWGFSGKKHTVHNTIQQFPKLL